MARRIAQNSGEQQPRRRVGASRGRPFKKGESGNPGGRPKEIKDVQALARSHTAEAIETLVEIMRNGKPDRARSAAAELLLDRGWGRAPQTIDIPDEREKILANLTDDELIERVLMKREQEAERKKQKAN
jgi:hypothetical protein